ncbi:Integrase [Pseudomonas brassicacearum]
MARIAQSGEFFDLLYRVNDGALGPAVLPYLVDARVANGKIVQQMLFKFTANEKAVITPRHVYFNAPVSPCIRSFNLYKRDIVKTAEPMMHQVNMITVNCGHDDNDAGTARRFTHPLHGFRTTVGRSAHECGLSIGVINSGVCGDDFR